MIYTEFPVQTPYTSYIQGKSAPVTPSLLARIPRHPRSPNRHGAMTPQGPGAISPNPNLPKSKSASHLASRGKSGTTTPGGYRRSSRRDKENNPSGDVQRASLGPGGRTDSDWLLRASIFLSSENRESKGQSWLVSRASSTSLGRVEDGDEDNTDPDMFERERRARENAMASKHASRRGSLGFVLDDDDDSTFASRRGSQFASRTGSRTQLVTPGEKTAVDSYFAGQTMGEDEYAPGPDFVNLNEKLEEIGPEMDVGQDAEADVMRLVHGRSPTWFGSILGWNLFSVEENDEDDEEDGDASYGEAEECLSETSGNEKGLRAMQSLSEQRLSPPKSDEGSWQDAAWLLSVASKVAWS